MITIKLNMEFFEDEIEYINASTVWADNIKYLLKNATSVEFTSYKDHSTFSKIVRYTFNIDERKATIYRLTYGHITSSSI